MVGLEQWVSSVWRIRQNRDFRELGIGGIVEGLGADGGGMGLIALE